MSHTGIVVRGARQHNLKNIDVEIPLNQFVVVTGLSGSGKSSLAFDTLYAEGQRRYVETFSPYTRQFLERMDKPEVDRIEGIPPAIAIEQANSVRTSRSTVGTMTEIADYIKLLFPRMAQLECPHCGREVKPWSEAEIAEKVTAEMAGEEILVGFNVIFAKGPTLASAFETLTQQGYVRVILNNEIRRTDEKSPSGKAPKQIFVVQDRIKATPGNASRLREAIAAALRPGNGVAAIRPLKDGKPAPEEKTVLYSNKWLCPYDSTIFPEPTPALFSFNNPAGACPTCRGFGRTIEIDYERALPNRSLSIVEGVVKPWQTGHGIECQKDLMRHAKKQGIPTAVPFCDLTPAQQKFVIEGEREGSLQEDWEAQKWYGVKGYFQWLETKTYKMHVRVLLSRYRAYRTCPTCHGTRFVPQTLQFKIGAEKLNIAQINNLPLRETLRFFREVKLPINDTAAKQLHETVVTRLGYLNDVGLNYLTLDRSTRTLSGGEIQRVNLTSCLGNSLANTLFVLDEPTIGLHPRDSGQLVRIIKRLRDTGNTLVVVEHDETVMREADHLIDIGPGRGEAGGEIVSEGSFSELLKSKKSITAAYLRGEKTIAVPEKRRKARRDRSLKLVGATANNLKNVDVEIPLGLFVAVTGVSGSGKSTLVHDVVGGQLRAAKNLVAEEETESTIKKLHGAELVSEVTNVGQSPLTRSPRSNAVLYLGVYDVIRDLFGLTEAAQREGITAGDFSFNSGQGRCPRCNGAGQEKIEMQFLADLYITCPQCEGRRFEPHILQIAYEGKTIDQVLNITAQQALVFFDPTREGLAFEKKRRHEKIIPPLRLLCELGLGYLRLGQPLSQLSGGEAQRIKLLSYLQQAEASGWKSKGLGNRLFILDEPTTGLHFEDVRLLLAVLQRLVDAGNSLIVIEHNLDVIKSADWVIDMGPEAGSEGGKIIASGTPEDLAKVAASHTGRFLKEKLSGKVKTVTASEATKPRQAAPTAVQIRGARHHNLKNIDLDIRFNEMTVVTGLSGSGKSTLAFDLLFAEGQRRYLDSLNAYARQFVEQMEKPEVDSITGIPPAVAIEQRATRGGRKSTVATVSEIYQFIRLLFAKLGKVHDPETGEEAIRQSPEQIQKQVEAYLKRGDFKLLAPLVRGRKGFHTEVARWAARKGYKQLLVDGKWIDSNKFRALDRYVEHHIDVVVGELTRKDDAAARRKRIAEALILGKGTIYLADKSGQKKVLSTRLYCPGTNRAFDELEPRLFSFNSPHGWCLTCEGYGTIAQVEVDTEGESAIARDIAIERGREHAEEEGVCRDCHGQRLNPLALAVELPLPGGKEGFTIGEIGDWSIRRAREMFSKLRYSGREAAIARDVLPEITQRLKFLEEVGLDYLALNRAITTLSGGEAQRIRLASQLGSNLQGVMYVLDEPTIGLHPSDNDRLLSSLKQLKDKGNTLVVVEHDDETMRHADWIIDLGPGAGSGGGEVVAQGTWKQITGHKGSVTGQLLGEPMAHPLVGKRRPVDPHTPRLTIEGAVTNNLKNLKVDLPLGRLITLCGVSGAGKSTLLHDVLKPALAQHLSRKKDKPVDKTWKKLSGAEYVSAIYEVDQSPIGQTSRSTPATYIGLMDDLRKLFEQLPEARMRGFTAGHFSFNSGQGRCEACKGQGELKVEMNFLPSVHIPCEQCQSRRYKPDILKIRYNGKNIADVLEMTMDEAARFFVAVPKLRHPLELLAQTGLGYLKLGQRSQTLSGGEAQRIKLVTELAKTWGFRHRKLEMQKKHHIYLLEEPTIGLHLADVRRLLEVFQQLVDSGHTVVVIEHHLDVIAEADYVIELGPVGGEKGGLLIGTGTPEKIAGLKTPTGPYLKRTLRASHKAESRGKSRLVSLV